MLNQALSPRSKTLSISLVQGLLDVMQGSRQQVFVKEIQELGDNINFTLSYADTVYSFLVQEATYVNSVSQSEFQAEKWRTEQMNYKKQIQIIKDAAAQAKINAIFPFVRIWAPMAAEESDEDVLAEFEGFSERLAGITVPVAKLDPMLDMTKLIKRDCYSKLVNARGYDKNVKKLNDEIEELALKLKAKEGVVLLPQIEDLLPTVLKKFGLDVLALVRALKIYIEADGSEKYRTTDDIVDGREHEQDKGSSGEVSESDTDILANVGKERESHFNTSSEGCNLTANVECETELREKQKRLHELLGQRERSENDHDRWVIMFIYALELERRISLIIPKSKVITRLAEEVKFEVDRYIFFLQDPNCKDQGKRQNALAEIMLAQGLYMLLDYELGKFSTQAMITIPNPI
ncbi:hypothetical protein GYMLUDRAFT_1005828 [Collybiopsis luxurians FD-317 M1]|uniref:Uncharacterized protein n=1 Tax=Collybiopsis luxurians FD-317 M1 TaxID=944289 RepID=A0A0D0B5E6_9AGAR|nr:hypothetical protein GYMLUDRAFT_1005828 [Collybiopsis luxurians FD-317 M1]